jgi:C1A family cysteine protease
MNVIKFIKIISIALILFSVSCSITFATNKTTHLSFSSSKSIHGLRVSGTVNFTSKNGSARVVLITQTGQELLVYESFQALEPSLMVSFSDECEETCELPETVIKELRLEAYNASIHLENPNLLHDASTKTEMELQKSRLNLKTKKSIEKIDKINRNNNRLGKQWLAGETLVGNLDYEEKKKLFRNRDGVIPEIMPNLQGFEYYKSGVFEFDTENSAFHNAISTSTSAIKSPYAWDWRNAHGQNWITSVKDQGPFDTCSHFAMTGAFESMINLYFNQHFDFDLSEQSLINCGSDPRQWDGCFGGTICGLKNIGIVDENCVSYIGESRSCESGCQDYNQKVWKPADYRMLVAESFAGRDWRHIPINEYTGDELIKTNLIKYGPMEIDGVINNHSMVLVGYYTDRTDGRPVYIVKNSWGTNWGMAGYADMKVDSFEYNIFPDGVSAYYFHSPAINLYNNYSIACNDFDRDSYCNWGISENMPHTCPTTCKIAKDCNDDNPSVGSFDTNLTCISLPMGDVNNDGTVDYLDYQLLIAQYTKSEPRSDMNGNKIVDVFDYSILMGRMFSN